LGYLKLDLIAFLQALIPFGRDRAVVNEDVSAIFAADKTVSLGIIEPLYRTFQTFHLRPLGANLLNTSWQIAPPDFLPFSGYSKRLSRGRNL
jgi:hypothetical protein